MTEVEHLHDTSTTLIATSPLEMDSGTDLEVKVRVSCAAGCDLEGASIHIVDAEAESVGEFQLGALGEAGNETELLTVSPPTEAGEVDWTVVFPAQEHAGVQHAQSSAPLSFVVKPHNTTIAVWDAPGMVVLGTDFEIQTGVTCAHGCDLAGTEIEVYDREGVKVATAALGEPDPDSESDGYCAQVQLTAPAMESRYRFTVRFPQPDVELAHEEAVCTFAFGTVRPNDHVVTVEVVDKETKTPVDGASVMLRPRVYRGSEYRTRSDEDGRASLGVPQGNYQLHAFAEGKEAFKPKLVVDGDLTIRLEIETQEVQYVGLMAY